jgi:hypothetical protein
MDVFSLTNLYFLFELTALVLSLLYLGRIRRSSIRLLPLYMLVIVVFDITAWYMRSKGISTKWINDIVIPFEFCYLLLFIRSFLTKQIIRRVVVVAVVVYLVLFIVDEFYFRNTYPRLYIRSYVAGVLALLIAVVMYVYQLLNSDKLFEFYYQPAFWICAGVLLFYLGSLPFHLAWNVTSVKFINAYLHTKGIFYFLICAMYVFFSISILCLKQREK